MLDFTRERPIDIPAVAAMFNVNQVTVRRWFKRGLDSAKMGGKVVTTLEALNRFQKCAAPVPRVHAVPIDRETLAALKSLKKRGFIFGQSDEPPNRNRR